MSAHLPDLSPPPHTFTEILISSPQFPVEVRVKHGVERLTRGIFRQLVDTPLSPQRQTAFDAPVMRVAALYDIHGNLPALEAVLGDVRQAGVDQVVIGGDVFPGPMPRESLACLLDLDLPVQLIQGNGDREVLVRMRGTDPDTLPEQYREVMRWVAGQLGPDSERILAGWPGTLRVPIDGLGEVLFCHAAPRSDTELFTRLTPEERLLPVFEGLGAAIVLCGHTHMQFDRTIGGVRVINAGSVGMPFGEPGADWLLLGPEVELRHTDYDLGEAAPRMGETDYPQVRDFAAKYVLHPPSEEEMLEAFGQAQLK